MNRIRVEIVENIDICRREIFENRIISRSEYVRLLVIAVLIAVISIFLISGLKVQIKQYFENSIQLVSAILAFVLIFECLAVAAILFQISTKYALYRWKTYRVSRAPDYRFRQYVIEFDDENLCESNGYLDSIISWDSFELHYVLPMSIKLYFKNYHYRTFPRECLGDYAFNEMVRIVEAKIPKGKHGRNLSMKMRCLQ